jgi:hypothetical protein
MIFISILSSINAFIFYLLSERISTAEDDVATTWNGNIDTALGRAFKNYCLGVITDDLLPTAVRPGLASISLRFRDHQDNFMNVDALIKEMAVTCNNKSYENILKLIEMFYKLDYTLNSKQDLSEHVLLLLEDRLKKNDGTKKIGDIKKIKSGQRCDTQIMTPVRFGSHVEQPLSVVVYSVDKKVIHKAEVLCR